MALLLFYFVERLKISVTIDRCNLEALICRFPNTICILVLPDIICTCYSLSDRLIRLDFPMIYKKHDSTKYSFYYPFL